MEPYGTILNPTGPYGTIWLNRTIRDHPAPYGTIKYFMGPSGIYRTIQDKT